MATLGSQLSELANLFSGVAGVDPLSALLLALGAVLVVGSSAVLGYLALGAAVDLVIPDRVGQSRRPGA